jgi:quinol-cytochrome oxidoreductase complex cytochrome b subunit
MTAPTAPTAPSSSWTARLRGRTLDAVSSQDMLPDRQPAYVASWIYVFGVATLAALIVVLVSGLLISLGGPSWWHTSSFGHFVNSVHLWSVELFFFVMVVHLWGKFFMAAWRGNRVLTWMTGVVSFLVSVAAAFTGYLVQTNFDSQWIAAEAKDGINSTGAGAFFNVLNVGQMLLWHVMLLPLGVGIVVVLHVVLVRVRGVVPPIGIGEDGEPLAAASSSKEGRS